MTIGDVEGVNRYCSQLVSSIWRFPTKGWELNLDLILSGSSSAGNEVTGGLPYTAG